MISNFNIKNFKLFENFSLENIPRILLIGGKNNTGKTSLLEAIFLCLDFIQPNMFIKHLNWRGINNITNNEDILFAPAFSNFELNKPIIFEYQANSAQRKITYEYIAADTTTQLAIDDDKDIGLNKDTSPINFAIKISYWADNSKSTKPIETFLRATSNQLNLNHSNEFANFAKQIKAAFLPSTKSITPEKNAQLFSALDVANNTSEIISTLQIIEPNLRSLSINSLGKRPVIYGDIIGLKKKIPLSLMGQGIDRLVSIMLAISHVKNGIALIDEIENGFHYSTLAAVWEVLAKYAKINNSQIIATTHSRELLIGAIEGIPADQKDEFKYIRIERDNQKFKTKNYDYNNLNTALASDFEIR